MSYTEMLVVNKEGDVISHKEYRNSHGSAPVIWDYMANKYLGGRMWLMPEVAEELWQLPKSGRLSREELVCLVLTFDRVVFSRECWPDIISSLRILDKEVPANRVNHLGIIADDIEALLKEDDWQGICFNMTSISCDFWWVHPEEPEEDSPEWDDFDDTPRHYNLNTDDNHILISSVADMEVQD